MEVSVSVHKQTAHFDVVHGRYLPAKGEHAMAGEFSDSTPVPKTKLPAPGLRLAADFPKT
jgi:hypothetical protein